MHHRLIATKHLCSVLSCPDSCCRPRRRQTQREETRDCLCSHDDLIELGTIVHAVFISRHHTQGGTSSKDTPAARRAAVVSYVSLFDSHEIREFLRLAMLPFFDIDHPTDDDGGGSGSTEVEVLGGEVQRTCSVAASMAIQAFCLGSKSDGGLVKRRMDALFEVVCYRLFSKTVKINHCVGFLYLLEDITSKLTVHTLDLLPQLIAILTALITVTTVWKKALRQSSEDEDAAVEVEDGKNHHDDDDEVVVEVEPVGGGHHLESFLSETKLKQMRGMCLKRLNELLEVHCALEEEAASGAACAMTLDDTSVSVRDTVRWGVSSVSYLLLETGTLQNLPTISAASKKPPAILNFMHSALRNPAWAPEVNVAFVVAEFCFTKKPQSQRECDPKQLSAIMKAEKPGLVIGKILECISYGTGQYKSSAHQGNKGV
jgi:hypothetical protein